MATLKKIKKVSTKTEEEPIEEIIETKTKEENDKEDAIRKAIRKVNSKVKKFPGEKLPSDMFDEEEEIEEDNDNEEDIEEDNDNEEDVEEENNDEKDIEEKPPVKKVTKKTTNSSISKKDKKSSSKKVNKKDENKKEENKKSSFFNDDKRPKNNNLIPNRNINRISKKDLIDEYDTLVNNDLKKKYDCTITKKENEDFFNKSYKTLEMTIDNWETDLLDKYGSLEKVPETERSVLISFIKNKFIKVEIVPPRIYPNPKNPELPGYYSDWGIKVSFSYIERETLEIIKETDSYIELEDGQKINK